MGLISADARRSFEQLFQASMQSNMRRRADDDVQVSLQPALSGRTDQYSAHILLTTASLRFKLVAVFRIIDETLARAYFGADNTADYLESLFECGNLSCGAMNRELLTHFPHMGLSTPSLLNAVPAKLLAELQAEHVAHFAVLIEGQHVLDVSLCMRGQAQVDFVYAASEASVEAGELELL